MELLEEVRWDSDPMIGAELGEGDAFGEGDTSDPPLPESLRREEESISNDSVTESIDQHAIGMFMARRHDPNINAPLTDATDQSFIVLNGDQHSSEDMGNLADTISSKIRQRLEMQDKKPADLARALGFSPQRLNNYIRETKPRAPDVETLVRIARALRTTPDWLLGLSEAAPLDVSTVLLRLLELEGLPQERAEAIAVVVREALRGLSAAPDEGDARTRARMAAQIAWQILQTEKPG